MSQASDAQWLRRGQRFFHSQQSKDAIVNIARATTLVIYCGAGVTMNRTGLSWYELVSELLLQEAVGDSRAHDRPEDENAARRQLAVLRSALAPQHMASILSQTRLANAESEQTELSQLVHKLHTLLYRDNGWQSGVIVRNIIRLAFGFLRLDRRVVIVTTNYDDYLEQEFDAYRRQVRRNRRERHAEPPPVPGLKVSVLDERHVWEVRNTGGAGQLEILYLHGRITQHRGYSGRIVLSEWDYHQTNSMAIAVLSGLFGLPDSAVLVLGSSLTDPPLLTALADTRHGRPHDSRYALLPAQDAGITRAENLADFEKITDYVGRRGQHFGVRLLVPDFRYQIAQFCEEVYTSVLAPEPESYLDEAAQMRYGLRLVAWWARWCQTEYNRRPEAIYEVLTRTVDGVRRHLAGFRVSKPTSNELERMKIELWIRDDPESQRRLALWGSSVGVLVDRSTARTEDLSWGSGNASVRAFIEGQPQYVTKKVLNDERQPDQPDRNTRWEAFVSVPILIDYGADQQPVGLPVGVVTLATMQEPHKSSVQHRSSPLMSGLIQLLRSAGETLLRA